MNTHKDVEKAENFSISLDEAHNYIVKNSIFFYFVTLSLVQESPFDVALMMGARLKSSTQHHIHSHFTEVYLLC